MRKYFLTKRQKIGVILVSMLYIAYTIYYTNNFTVGSKQIFSFLPYSEILFILLVSSFLLFMKYKNWKNNLKILTLVTILVTMFYMTSIQLQALFYFDASRFRAGVNYNLIKAISPIVNSQIYYRIGKIVLFDIFFIFSFWAINKTINSIERTDE